MVWGECPICNAAHGEPCVDGKRIGNGAHLMRLHGAPMKVQEVPYVD